MKITDTGVLAPGDIDSFTLDWADWLAKTEDTIVDCDITDTGGLTLYENPFSATDTTAKLGGAASGGRYDVIFRITTAADYVWHRTLTINGRTL